MSIISIAPDGAPEGDLDTPLHLVRSMATSKIRRRRFETLPLRGPGAAFTSPQGRAPSDTTTPAELSDLISSISEIGVLQPILVEETTDDEGPAQRLLVAGERRLRACRWGAVHLPDNPHFNEIPAIICPGPLSDEERRIWQLIENLAREPLRPGEQAAALLLQRCAILTGKLLGAGKPVPAEVYDLADPAERFAALEHIRAGDNAAAAPWSEVLSRLGLQLTPRKARELVRAFSAMPRGLSEEMDEQKIALHTRIRFARLLQGRQAAAEQIWEAVKARQRPDLLPGALHVADEAPKMEADHVLDEAAGRQAVANQSRAEKLSTRSSPLHQDLPAEDDRQPNQDEDTDGTAPGGTVRGGRQAEPLSDLTTVPQAPTPYGAVAADAAAALHALRALAAQLRGGSQLTRYDAGSLQLVLQELDDLIKNGPTG